MVKRDDVENMTEDQIRKLRISIILACRHYDNYLKECAEIERKKEEYKNRLEQIERLKKEKEELKKYKKEELAIRRRQLEEQKQEEERRHKEFLERKAEEERRYKEQRKHNAMVRKLFTSYSLDIPYMTMNQIQEAYQDATADYSNIYDT